MEKDVRQEIESVIESPDPAARGYTRWWWFGGAVTKEEIARELDLMLEAQIGGVELQILYPICADDPERGIQNQWYLSPDFLEAIRYTCEEANKRGMVFDMTLGSSWPYGGPFVPKNLSAPNVVPYMLDVMGPVDFSYDFTTRVYGECVGCVMGRMEHCRMVPESIVDLTDRVEVKLLFGWEWGIELKRVSIPKGDYKIVLFISNDKRQTVLKPLPGGEGLIIDHNRKDALRHFLRHAGDPIAEYLGEGRINSYFCDSLEVFGQNWTDIIYEEFRERRGYELRPWIYALWGEIAGSYTERIRYDFNKTMAELTEENFFGELVKWSHEKGASARIQAHGTWGDILRCYGLADIPEGETFSQYDRYEVNTVHRRLAASAGHVYHKPVISNESFTWLRFPRFVVTLENLKAAVDSIFLDGMNHIVNHGFAYSPEGTGKLGWPFYASTQINHKNTWWPYYRELGRYINRVSDWLRRGEPVVRLAIYLPQSDIWAENPLSDIHMCMKLEECLSTEAVDAIQKAGYWFDYVNDDVCARLEEYSYEALIILECCRIPLKTAQAMEAYVRNGGLLICKGDFPDRACGYLDYKENTWEIRHIFRRLEKSLNCIRTECDLNDLLHTLDCRVKPDVRMLRRRDVVGYVHRRDGDRDIYFLANISPEWVQEEIVFSRQTHRCVVYDLLTGKEKEAALCLTEDGEVRAAAAFEPFQSLLFVFAPELGEAPRQEEGRFAEMKPAGAKSAGVEPMERSAAAGRPPAEESVLLELTSGWSLEVEERGLKKSYGGALTSWEQEPELRFFSGEGIYRKSFFLGEKEWERVRTAKRVLLKMEHLGEAGEIFVNGVSAGILIKRPHQMDLKKFLYLGENSLEIRVRNLLINCAIDPDYPEEDYPEPAIGHWPYDTGRLNLNREEFLYNQRERGMVKEPFASGIWGKVWLEVI